MVAGYLGSLGRTLVNRVALFVGLALAAITLAVCWLTWDIHVAINLVVSTGARSRVLLRALIPIIGAAPPALILGTAFGLLARKSVAICALAVAGVATVLKFSFTVVAVAGLPHWLDFIEYVLLIVLFVTSASVAARAAVALPQHRRSWWGAATFGAMFAISLITPWLIGCLSFGLYGCAA